RWPPPRPRAPSTPASCSPRAWAGARTSPRARAGVRGESRPAVHPFAVLGDPVRRRIVELLAEGERTSGEVVDVVGDEFGITQSAVSQQLKVLRDAGFATVRAEGRRRIYALDPGPLRTIDEWLAHYRAFWRDALEDLAAEVERGKAERAARE